MKEAQSFIATNMKENRCLHERKRRPKELTRATAEMQEHQSIPISTIIGID